ncbi:TolC family protein [Marispirochaeta sp.]|uniref:TolC family protein n=1 Tax=Marispirochaeta sp. TaxID=2038653 RepID=UPI0029C99486|nr:TolC family protein [Marispirochaeta sp.]
MDRKEYAPAVSLSLAENIASSQLGNAENSGSISLSASISLSQWKRNNTVKQGDIAVRQAAFSSGEMYREYFLNVESSWSDLISAARTAISAATAYEYAEELHRETREMYQLSVKSLSDLTDAEAILISYRNTLISARFDFMKCISDLVCVIGLKDEETLWEIIGV